MLIIPLNAEDAADWPDITDDQYGSVVRRPSGSRLDIGAEANEALRRMGLLEEGPPPSLFERAIPVLRLIGISALVIFGLHYCHEVPSFPG